MGSTHRRRSPGPSTRSRFAGLSALAAALLLAVPVAGASDLSITVVLADDLRADDVVPELMPRTSALLASAVRFEAAVANYPLCVPSRASLLTGRLPRTTGITTNDGTQLTPWEADTIAVRLQAAGYRTAIVGKYANNAGSYEPRPGWTDWLAVGSHRAYGAELQTDTIAAQAEAIHAAAAGPLFLYVAPIAPHGPFAGPSRCQGRDYPPPPYPEHAERWQQRVTSLCALDDLVADRIERRRNAEWLFFTSDHGFIFDADGTEGKNQLRWDAAHVPLYAWGAAAVPRDRRELVSMVDLAATILRLAQAPRDGLDGQSFRALLRDEADAWGGTLEVAAAPPTPAPAARRRKKGTR